MVTRTMRESIEVRLTNWERTSFLLSFLLFTTVPLMYVSEEISFMQAEIDQHQHVISNNRLSAGRRTPPLSNAYKQRGP